jgi:hypothetical protein
MGCLMALGQQEMWVKLQLGWSSQSHVTRHVSAEETHSIDGNKE